MSLLPTTTAQSIASQIDAINIEATSYERAQLARVWALATTPGEEQNILDAFGVNAVAALTAYAARYQALVAISAAEGVTPPDFERFTPQPDGTVIYVDPPEPEEEPEEEEALEEELEEGA